ncbi:hypothetical protein AAKU67_004359 [Oxalobacteraceae bacterium GrIS 2.11]
MDITEFEKTMRPNRKRSQMDPFTDTIFELRDKGYANWQIGEFLAHNGVHVSAEAVRQFIKSRENNVTKPPKLASTVDEPVTSASTDFISRDEPTKDVRKKANRYITGGLDEHDIDSLVSPNSNKK